MPPDFDQPGIQFARFAAYILQHGSFSYLLNLVTIHNEINLIIPCVHALYGRMSGGSPARSIDHGGNTRYNRPMLVTASYMEL